MDKLNIKNELLLRLKLNIKNTLDQLIKEEKEKVKAASEDRVAGENLIESNSEEVMQSTEDLKIAADQFGFIYDYLSTLHFEYLLSEVGPLAVVVTDHERFFISAYSDPLKVNGDMYLPLSISSPIFPFMKNKKRLDEFSFKGRRYHILDVF